MESIAFIQFCLDHLNYWTVMFLMIIESSFIPFPSEIVVPPAAWMAAVEGKMNIYLIVFFATLGADIGALINYFLARWLGRPIVYKFANSRFGHVCLIDENKVKKAEAYFEKHGAISTLIGRLIPGIRQLISIPAGLARMKLGPFLLYTTIGAGVWNCILAAIGYYIFVIFPEMSKQDMLDKAMAYSHEIGFVFIGILVLIVAFLVYKGLKKPKKSIE